MSFDKEKEFKKECIGYVASECFPSMCAHFQLNEKCNFFISKGGWNYCDDLKYKENDARIAHN
jgi:hypothetical protein